MQQQGSPRGQSLAFDQLQGKTWNAGRGADRNEGAERVAGLRVTLQELQIASPAVRNMGHSSSGSSARPQLYRGGDTDSTSAHTRPGVSRCRRLGRLFMSQGVARQ